MLDLGTLRIGIKVDSNTAKSQLRQVDSSVKQFSTEAQKSTARAASSFDAIGTAATGAADSTRGVSAGFAEVGDSADKAKGRFGGLKDSITSIGTVAKAAIGAAAVAAVSSLANAIGSATSQCVSLYGELEQLEGGVNKLFQGSASTVMENANSAFESAGISANDYMEQITKFSASLIKSVGGDTAKAAASADTAIKDMADNANTFGTSIEEIQNAYQGFAKGNYTMLDNLRLGYSGTQEDMEKLLADAEKLSGQKYELGNFNDMVQAIHVVQDEMGITGTTAKEANGTIEGSVNQAKAAWENFQTALANPEVQDLSTYTQDLLGSITTLVPQVMESVGSIGDKIGPAVGTLFEQAKTTVLQNAPTVVGEVIPQLITNVVSTLLSTATELTNTVSELIDTMFSENEEGGTAISDYAINLITGLADALLANVPQLIAAAGRLITSVLAALPALIRVFFTFITGTLIPGIANRIGAGVGKLITGGKKLLKGLLNGIKNGWESVKSWVSGLPDRIANAVGDLGRCLKDAGKDVMDGFKNGLKTGWETVKGWLNSLAGLIPKNKGPEKVDKAMLVDNGIWVMEGFNKGLNDGWSKVKKNLASMTASLANTTIDIPLYANAQYAGVPAATSTTVYNLYINGAKINNDSAIERKFVELMDEVDRKERM